MLVEASWHVQILAAILDFKMAATQDLYSPTPQDVRQLES